MLTFPVSRQRLLGVFLHFPGHLLGPFIVWLAKRDDSPEIDAHGKESLNFQISMLIYNAVAAVFCLILIGFVFLAGHRRSISQSRARLPWSHSESR